MLKFKVLGSGCTKCKSTAQLIEDNAQALGVDVSVEKVQDPAQIMAYSVMSTPAVVMDENVVFKGGVPSKDQVVSWLQSA
ncbi:thioredoxin family protein [Glaciecola sp. XM2]|uniref:thioredoxin family protein n=1 Tax=Glaciecola sp. XM2 TaxID=1914931 RepID=UPI001BDEF36C|nr:thioredoxin family protein [Glaciecola sp. XM2]MBT1449306.1 thioredoxin family protein [Glaciecola sp. XM2]